MLWLFEQVREKYLALKKDTKPEVVTEFEEVCFLSEHSKFVYSRF